MSYLPHANGPKSLSDALANIEEGTRGHIDEFDGVFVTGLSGIVPAAIFCHMYNKRLIVLRKDGESAHGARIAGHWEWDKHPYIILDDFTSSGATLNRLMEQGESESGQLPEFIVLHSPKYNTFNEWSVRNYNLIPTDSDYRFDFERKPCAYTSLVAQSATT